MWYIFRLSLIIACTSTLVGCCSVLLGTVAGVSVYSATDKRTLGTQVDDKILMLEVRNIVNGACDGRYCNLRYNAFEGEVVVVGDIDIEYTKDTLINKIRENSRATKVFSDISITGSSQEAQNKTQDVILEKNIALQLILEKKVESGRYSIIVHDKVAYVLGKAANKEELEQVILVIRNVKDVEKVVSYAYVNHF
ncbi:BON domain-containing protein [Candidatus Fokinia crypta]|uniref:Outer membrane lipoprotein n=1 Tax=Candidatus Fokinia crypta TaxID=1920990 RepID=A0ABZ0UP74_9RICK|nr:BON domain-containing protein [Candidatus Fokinia cryptica]WPX97931.1 Putative outer membrane lipoprotein [Candidatus Fokinia cryptica]